MTMPGECVYDVRTLCCECQSVMDVGVQRSAAGYYVGFSCPCCGPYSRESGYYRSFEEAQEALGNSLYWR